MYPPSPDLALLQAPDSGVPSAPQEEVNQVVDQAQKELDDEELDAAILALIEIAEKEDLDIRQPMLAKCKRNDYYFNNIQTVYYDAVARDYRSIESALAESGNQLDDVDDVKMVQIYRAYAESLISALSVEAPNMEVAPDDAENPEDIQTAETYQRAGEMLSKHNEAPLMIIKALTIQFNFGTIFIHNYYKKDPAYGVIRKPIKEEQKPKPVFDLRCQYCGELIDSGLDQEVVSEGSSIKCPNCDYTGPPNVYKRLEYITEVTEWEDTPKGRSGFDIFGPNYVKVPMYARRQENCGYLILRLEDDCAKFKAVYEDDDIDKDGSDTEKYERWSRIPPEYVGTMPEDLTTARYAWFRPWFYKKLKNETREELLNRKFPNGLCVTVIGKTVLERTHERLDDRWTISFDPRANFIHAEPPGNALVPMQDVTTDIFNLGLQSIEFGIPETFVHPKTLNLKKYSSTPAAPGMMTNANPPEPGRQLSEGFHTVQTATLSGEYTQFSRDLTSMTQFITGAFPSIFGGSNLSGSDTATEYVESRGRALQRLQLTWGIIKCVWSKMLFKCTTDYLTNLIEDDKFTDKKNGTFINVWIRKSSLNGKVGHVEPELDGHLPQSWAQKKEFLMNLIQLANPELTPIILHPSNVEILKKSTGMPEFYIPGEHDRNKQFSEFYELSQGQPQGDLPSVDIDIDVDDHVVHMLVLKNILVSQLGMQLYKENPAGYENNIMHYRRHELANQAKTMAPAGTSGAGEPPPTASKSNEG